MRQKHELGPGNTVTLRNTQEYGWREGDSIEVEFSDIAGRTIKIQRIIGSGNVIYLADVANELFIKPGKTVWLNILRDGKTVYPKVKK